MRYYLILSFFLLLSVAHSQNTPKDVTLDDNTAFYEGANNSYIIAPPKGFVMITDSAASDGYSFAFIPKGEKYATASVRIGINIFKIKKEARDKFKLDDLIKDDTLAYRIHFGETINIDEVAPTVSLTGDSMRTIYYNDTTTFIPNVMMSYLDGHEEILIFELSINESYPRFEAEKVYMECLNNVKMLEQGSLGVG